MGEIVKLTALDLLMLCTWTRWTLHFRVQKERVEAVVSLLEQAFNQLLQEIPLLGGYLIDSTNRKDHVNHIVVPSNPQSRFSIVNFSNDADDSEANWYPLGEYPSGKAEEVQICAAQANIVEGGIILAFCVHHMFMDGTSMSLVLRRWSEHSGIKNDTIKHPAYRIVPSNSEADVRPPSARLDEDIKMPVNLFAIDIKALAQLKKYIFVHLSGHPDPEAWVSSSDILTALLWTSITRARLGSHTPDQNRKSRLNYGVNACSRFNPPLPSNFIGCAAVFATAQLPMADLFDFCLESLTKTALAIRKGVDNVNGTYLRVLIISVNELEDGNMIFPAANFCLGDDIIVNSWLDFGTGELNWGEQLGKIEKLRKTRYPSGKGYDGLNTVLPRKADGVIEVIISLREEHMKRLIIDEMFGMYARLIDW